MAGGLGFKTFNTGEVLTSADVNGYLMQGVLVFASEAARNAAITSPQEGQFAYTKDNNSLWYYTGSAWAASGATGDIEGVTAGTGISGGGTSGTVTITNSMATEIDAKGDLIVGTGADTFARLAVGTNGHTLVADSAETTGLKWAAPAAASFKGALVYMAQGVTQSIPNNAGTQITFASEQYDTDAFHSTVTNTNRLTIPAGLGGYYLIYGNLRWSNSALGRRRMDFEVNGSGNTYGVVFAQPTDNNATTISSIVLNLSAGDWVGILGTQTSGGNLDVQGNQAIAGCYFGLTYLGA